MNRVPTAEGVSRLRRRLLLLGGGVLAGCGSPITTPPRPTVHGRVEFSAEPLPAGALLEVSLEDTARADAPSVRIASWRLVDPRPGVEYALVYNSAAVPGHARLAVRARITDGARLLHTTDRHHAVPSAATATRVDLALRRVMPMP